MIERLPNYVKPTAFFSILMGLIFGVCLATPIIQLFIIFGFWIVGGIIVYLLKKNNFIGKFTQKEAVVIGAISGMFSTLAASMSFLPISMIVGAFTNTVSPTFLFNTPFFSSVFSFFVLLMLIFFVGLFNIIMNVGSALMVIWVYDNFEDKKEEEESTEFKVEL